MSNAEAVELQRTLNTLGWRYILKLANDICEEFALDAIECDDTNERRLQLQSQAQASRKFFERLQNAVYLASQVQS